MAYIPNDLWLEVINHLDRKELKTIRLAGKDVAALAVARLFRQVIIRPNVDSLKRAFSIAGLPAIAHAVQELELRAETVFHSPMEIVKYARENAWQDDQHISTVVDLGKFITRRGKLALAEADYRRMDEAAELARLCRQLPSLHTLHRRVNDGYSRYVGRSSFAKSYGLFPTKYWDAFHVPSMLAACEASQIRSLRWESLHWSECQRDLARFEMSGTPLGHVRELHLVLEAKRSLPRRGLEEHVHALSTLLGILPELQHLSLNLDVDLFWHDHTQQTLWQHVLQQNWKHLQSINFDKLVCTEQALLDFIARHRTSLKHVRFGGLTLCDSEEVEAPINGTSVMRALWTIPRIVALDSCILEEEIRSCGEEDWQIYLSYDMERDTLSRDCNLVRLEGYMCRQYHFPFPELAEALNYEQVFAASGLRSVDLLPYSTHWTGDLGRDNNQSDAGDHAASRISGHKYHDPVLLTREDKQKLFAACSDDTFTWNASHEMDCDWSLSFVHNQDPDAEDDLDDFTEDDIDYVSDEGSSGDPDHESDVDLSTPFPACACYACASRA